MELWSQWMALVKQLESAFGRKKTFFWFILVLFGFTVKFDSLGVTSLARGVGLLPSCYTSMLSFFTSTAVNLTMLTTLWVALVFRSFGRIVRINGRCIIAGDGIKIGKEGKRMPAVKLLHQESDSNSKAEYIMGHSIQALCVLAHGLGTCFAVPLAARIHEGVRFHYSDCRTLLDKMFDMLMGLGIKEACYLVLDKYYCSGRFMKRLVAENIHIVTMMKKNASAYWPPVPQKKTRRGRPVKYGEKVKLFSLFEKDLTFLSAPMPGNGRIMIEYHAAKLFWKPLGGLVLFVLTRHPIKGDAIVMSTDLLADPLSLIEVYSLRFKIEVFFKVAVRQLGAFLYRFWLKKMAPKKRGSGDQALQFSPKSFKESIQKKIHSYHLFIQTGFIAHGLLQYLSMHCHHGVWGSFRTWLRTIRQNTLPSEMVVARAMKNTYNEFLLDGHYCSIFRKFLLEKLGIGRFRREIPTSAEVA